MSQVPKWLIWPWAANKVNALGSELVALIDKTDKHVVSKLAEYV